MTWPQAQLWSFPPENRCHLLSLHGAYRTVIGNDNIVKALFLSLPLHGHTNPSLPLVRELVGRGDEIVYCSTAAFAAAVEQSGARYRPYRAAFLADMQRLPERMDQLSWLILRTTAEVLDQELDAFRAERPDYVITDSVAPWGQWVGQILHVPVVTSISTFAFNRHVAAFGVSHGVRPKSAQDPAVQIAAHGQGVPDHAAIASPVRGRAGLA